MVHAINKHRRVVLAWGGLDDFLGARIEVRLAGFLGQEEAGAFDHDINLGLVPFEVGRVALGGQADILAVDDQIIAVDRNVAFEAAMH